MNIWYHILPYNVEGKLIEAVSVSRETDKFIYVDETQTWNGKRVTRQRRVAKAQGMWAGSYFPTKLAALTDIENTARTKINYLQKELDTINARKLKAMLEIAELADEHAQEKEQS